MERRSVVVLLYLRASRLNSSDAPAYSAGTASDRVAGVPYRREESCAKGVQPRMKKQRLACVESVFRRSTMALRAREEDENRAYFSIACIIRRFSEELTQRVAGRLPATARVETG